MCSSAVTAGEGIGEYTVKKGLTIFPSPAGMSLTELSLGGNNLNIPAQPKKNQRKKRRLRAFVIVQINNGKGWARFRLTATEKQAFFLPCIFTLVGAFSHIFLRSIFKEKNMI